VSFDVTFEGEWWWVW